MNDFNPLVSIVIPVYNGANFMREAIDSALAQTYDNVEIIVVNDGSRDNGQTREIALTYGDRIRYYEKENGGCATALNHGIAQIKGEYFSWLSHDDKYLPEKIEHQINALRDLPDKRTILYGGYQVIDADSKPLFPVCPDRVLPAHKLNIPLLPLLRGLINGCTLLVPVELFKEVGLFDPSLPSTQDYALWFEFFRRSPIHFTDRQLVLSRTHPDQGTHKITKHIDECNDLWSSFLRRLSDSEMTAMEGSPYSFLLRTAEFLEGVPYTQAAQLARSLAESALRRMKVSVIIPFYNRIGWTIEAIRSVQSQTHPNFEVILVDDGSTEDLTPIQQMIVEDSRIKYYRQSNAGPAVARNYGISLAEGEYVAFLDSDDFFHPEKLSAQLHYMEDGQFLISHTSYQRVDLERNPLGAVSAGSFSGHVFPRIIASCPIAMPTVMVRTSLLRENRFPEHMHIGEDVCLWISLASKCELGALEPPLSSVRIGPSTAAFDSTKQCLGLVGIAHFALSDPFLASYQRQIKSLLEIASSHLSESTNPTPSPSFVSLRLRSGWRALRSKFLRSLRDDGLRVTLRRVMHYLRR